MKKIARAAILCALLVATAACGPRERTVVVLSTNDMHAQIDNFPRLATAVEACRDTMDIVFLVDAGDRWTGNAYVDMAEGRRPILELMNRLGYDVATLGNHEFDAGHKLVADMIDYLESPVVCANFVSDTVVVDTTEPYVILEKGGVELGFVGVITNFEGGGYPAGTKENFARLNFPDPKLKAMEHALDVSGCDVRVLLSHMGTSHDRDLLAREQGYDVVVGGHSHEQIDESVGTTRLTQTGKNLQNVGVTTIRLRGNEIQSVDYRLVPLSGYEPSAQYSAMVERYHQNPELQRSVGTLSATATQVGLANLISELMRDEVDAEIGFYHLGGVRVDSLVAGNVPLAAVYTLEPFESTVCTMQMTPAQMRRAIIAKYNDPVNTKESHRVDFYSATPYVIVLDGAGDAIDVQFPTLSEGHIYKVAMGDYMYRKYDDLEYIDGKRTDVLITNLLLDELDDDSPISPDNQLHQTVRR